MISLTHSKQTAPLSQGATFVWRPTFGLLVLSDSDRADFLQRMTSNNISALRPGQSAVTVLTSPTARILFVFTVLCRENELWLLPNAGEATALERYLRGQIFFMDHVRVRNVSADWQRLRLMGPQTVTAVKSLGIALDDAQDGDWASSLAGVTAVVQNRYDVPGVELLIPNQAAADVETDLTAAGAVVIDDVAYAVRRVELGRPAAGAELTSDYSPLEAGLAWACADNKGCYTGQEIIARQVTYDKVTKTLVALRSAALLAPGAPLSVDGREVGLVTSAAFSPSLNRAVALGIVKRPHNRPGSILDAGGQAVEVLELS